MGNHMSKCIGVDQGPPMDHQNGSCCSSPFRAENEDYGLVSVQFHASRSSNPVHDMAQFYFDSKGTFKYDLAEFDQWSSTLCDGNGEQPMRRFMTLILSNMRRTIVEMNRAANEATVPAGNPPQDQPGPSGTSRNVAESDESDAEDGAHGDDDATKLAKMAARLSGGTEARDYSSDDSDCLLDLEMRRQLAKKFQAKRRQARKAQVLINTRNEHEITLTVPCKISSVKVVEDPRAVAFADPTESSSSPFECPQLNVVNMDAPPPYFEQEPEGRMPYQHQQFFNQWANQNFPQVQMPMYYQPPQEFYPPYQVPGNYHYFNMPAQYREAMGFDQPPPPPPQPPLPPQQLMVAQQPMLPQVPLPEEQPLLDNIIANVGDEGNFPRVPNNLENNIPRTCTCVIREVFQE